MTSWNMYVDPINDIAPVHFGNIANVLDWDDENAMIYRLLPDLSTISDCFCYQPKPILLRYLKDMLTVLQVFAS